MKTEMVTEHKTYPVRLQWNGVLLYTTQKTSAVDYTRSEAIQLRDFLIQLNLDKDEK